MKKPLLILLIYFTGISYLFAVENHPSGARSLALSHAYTSISDTWSVFHNQAGIADINQFSTCIHYESRFQIEELALTSGAIILPIRFGSFGLSFSQFGKGTFKESKFGLAFSKTLAQQLKAGIQLDYFSSRFPENSQKFGFTTFEAGLIYSSNEKLFLGVHVFNPISNGITTVFGKQNSPFVLRFGGHFRFTRMVLAIFEMQKNTEHPVLVKSGIEFSPVENLALRFGVSGKPINYTFGLGYNFNNISTDIGFSYHGNLGLTPSVSLQFQL